MKIMGKQRAAAQMNRVMRLTVFLLFATQVIAQAEPLSLAALIEISEVKNLGRSANNETKSVIQALWSVNAQPGVSIKSFELTLEIAYADGAIEKFKTTANGTERRARFEVPTQHLSAGRADAELRSFKANITANFSETASKQGNF